MAAPSALAALYNTSTSAGPNAKAGTDSIAMHRRQKARELLRQTHFMARLSMSWKLPTHHICDERPIQGQTKSPWRAGLLTGCKANALKDLLSARKPQRI
jgi:hypothetical protein